MKRGGAFAAALLLGAGLQGCCFNRCDADASDMASRPPIEAQALRIVAWGPVETRAGVPFNRQPNGQAALWIRLDRDLHGRAVLVQFEDAYFEGSATGDTVTASVPAAAYATAGTREVRVVATAGASRWTSGAVAFTVRQ